MSETVAMTPEELFEKYEGLVRFTLEKVVRFIHPSMRDDLLQEGNIGLWKAATTHQNSKGANFTTYAYICIRNQIFMYLRSYKKYDKLRVTSLDAEISSGEDLLFRDIIEDPRAVVDEPLLSLEKYEILREAIDSLPDFYKSVITLIYLEEKTQSDAAKLLGVSQSYVSRVLKKAVEKLREYFLTRGIDGY